MPVWKSVGVGLTGKVESGVKAAGAGAGLPSMVNIRQIVLAKSHIARGASHQPAFIGNCLTVSHTYLPCLPIR